MKPLHRKLVVGGCSASDYTGVEKVYGEHIAKKFKWNYIHEARGIGSNYRIWRTISNRIIKKELAPRDVIVIQYTAMHRQEFFSPYSTIERPLSNSKSTINDLYDSGSIIRYKNRASEWTTIPEEKEFFKLYENFSNKEFDKETFFYHNYSFQTLCLYYGIKNVYFLDTPYYTNRHLLKEFSNNVINITDMFKDYPLNGDDYFHLSYEGHKAVADKIATVFALNLN